jgi:ABC-2 type transport system permease protein
MALTALVSKPHAAALPGVRVFVRLKLRVLGNGFQGAGWRIWMAVLSVVGGVWFGLSGFAGFAMTAAVSPQHAHAPAVLGGSGVVMGWLVLPLLVFGVDETLDPVRFILLPLPRSVLVRGLFAAALLGIPAMMTFVATLGIVLGSAVQGGVLAAVVAFVGVVLGLVLCVVLSRAMTTAVATSLRSRRSRDRAAVVMAILLACLTPLEFAGLSAVQYVGLDRLLGVANVLAWTPLGAPYAVGFDVATGHWPLALARLGITAATIGLLFWLWVLRLPAAMLETGAGTRLPAARRVGRGRADPGGVGVGSGRGLVPAVLAWLPSRRMAALMAREWRYWLREPRRRAGLASGLLVGIMLPAMLKFGGTGSLSVAAVLAGGVCGSMLANQFGVDGTAYAVNLLAGVPGRLDIGARVGAVAAIVVPQLTVAIALVGVISRDDRTFVAVGAAMLAYGGSGAVAPLVSVIFPYALPETTNPFAMNAGTGGLRGLVSLVSILTGAVLAAPLVLLGSALPGPLAIVIGLAVCAALLTAGSLVAGSILDDRGPAILLAVTPRR